MTPNHFSTQQILDDFFPSEAKELAAILGDFDYLFALDPDLYQRISKAIHCGYQVGQRRGVCVSGPTTEELLSAGKAAGK